MNEDSKQTQEERARLEKLNALRDSIKQGTYQVEADAVADALIRAASSHAEHSARDSSAAAEEGTDMSEGTQHAQKPSSSSE